MNARLMIASAVLLAGLAPPSQAAGRSAGRSAAAPSCDAGCLRGLADGFLAGLESRRQGADVRWAPRVRYTENGVGMTVGDGIWATVTAHAADPLVVADPVNHSLVWLGAIEEHGQPGWLALRIKADGDRIVEAEAVMRRKEGRPPFADPTGFRPDPAFARASGAPAPRARLLALAQAALAAAPRMRNGVSIASPPAAALRGVVFPAVDPARGMVAAIGLRDHAGAATDPDGAFPHSYFFMTIFRIDAGKVVATQEVLSDVMPLLMPAWRIK